MKIDRNIKAFVLPGEDGETLTVRYANRGEPFNEGMQLSVTRDYDEITGIFLETREAADLRNFLNRLLPDPAFVKLSEMAAERQMSDERFLQMLIRLVPAVEGAVADLGAWLTDRTTAAFEEEPEIDNIRSDLDRVVTGAPE